MGDLTKYEEFQYSLDEIPPADGFECPKCGEYPRTTIGDPKTHHVVNQIEVPEYHEWVEIGICVNGHAFQYTNSDG